MMKRSPLILITPSMARKGVEFSDASISLSNRYTDAIIAGGGLPQIFPATTSLPVIAEAVRRCDGLLMSGGDDIDPKWYAPDMPKELRKKAGPLEPARDIWETELIKEAVAQNKPIFGVCRGHQMVNVALGGTLIVDIPTQLPKALNHRQMEKKSEAVHDVKVAPGSLLSKLTGVKSFGVNSTHHQAIDKMAPPLRAVGKSSDGVVEASEWKDPKKGFLLTVQFHPERLIDKNRVFRQLFDGFIEACARRREKNL